MEYLRRKICQSIYAWREMLHERKSPSIDKVGVWSSAIGASACVCSFPVFSPCGLGPHALRGDRTLSKFRFPSSNHHSDISNTIDVGVVAVYIRGLEVIPQSRELFLRAMHVISLRFDNVILSFRSR